MTKATQKLLSYLELSFGIEFPKFENGSLHLYAGSAVALDPWVLQRVFCWRPFMRVLREQLTQKIVICSVKITDILRYVNNKNRHTWEALELK